MPPEPVTPGALASATAAPVTLVELVRAAEALGLPPDAWTEPLDRLRRSRACNLDRLMRARALAGSLARHDRPATGSACDHDALDLLFRATRQALADLGLADRIAVEDAFVARAAAVPCSLGRELRVGLAAVAPVSRDATADRAAGLTAAVPGAASAPLDGHDHNDQPDRMKG